MSATDEERIIAVAAAMMLAALAASFIPWAIVMVP
jgi:hypothetical protein